MSTPPGTAIRIRQPQRAIQSLLLTPPIVGFVGIVLFPLVLLLACNSYGAPDAGDFVRMAFATVASAVIAMVTASALAVQQLIASTGRRYWYTAVALVILVAGTAAISSAGTLLLSRLG